MCSLLFGDQFELFCSLLLKVLLLTFLLSEEEVITGRPTFLLYGMMGRAMAGKVTEIPLKAFAYDLQSIAEQIKQETKIIPYPIQRYKIIQKNF